MATSEQLIKEQNEKRAAFVQSKAVEVGKIVLGSNLTIGEIATVMQILQNTVNGLNVNLNFDEKKEEAVNEVAK